MSTNDQPANRRSLKPIGHRSPCKYVNKVPRLPKISYLKKKPRDVGPHFSVDFSNSFKEISFYLNPAKIIRDIDFPADNDSAARELLGLMIKLKPSCGTKDRMQKQVRKTRGKHDIPSINQSKILKNHLNVSGVLPIQKSRVHLVKKRSESDLKPRFRKNTLNLRQG